MTKTRRLAITLVTGTIIALGWIAFVIVAALFVGGCKKSKPTVWHLPPGVGVNCAWNDNVGTCIGTNNIPFTCILREDLSPDEIFCAPMVSRPPEQP